MRRTNGKVFRYVLFGVVAVVALAVLIARPWGSYTKYYCPYCYAQTTRHWVFFVQLPGGVHEGELTRYWRKNVEPGHKHRFVSTWQVNAGLNRVNGEPCTCCPLTPARDRRAIAILKALPTPVARKALVEKHVRDRHYWQWDDAVQGYMPAPATR